MAAQALLQSGTSMLMEAYKKQDNLNKEHCKPAKKLKMKK